MLGGCFLFLFLHLSAFILTSFADPGKGAFGTKTREKNIQINGDKRSKTVDRGLDTSNFDISNDPNSLLADYINSRAKPYRRPVKHARDLIEVHVRASLYQVVDLDQRNNLATLLAYFDVWWIDEFIAWNASAFDGITHTYVPINWLWKPEFYLYHSIQGRTPDYANDATLEVHSDGKIRMFVPIASRSLCPVNLKFFPFDNQNCSFIGFRVNTPTNSNDFDVTIWQPYQYTKCGSWSYQSSFVRLIVEDREVFLGDFYDNQEWLLEDAYIASDTLVYLDNESYSVVRITLLLNRQSFYYVFNFVFPTTLASLVAVIGFHAPINGTGRRESKFRLGIMTLLSMSVMLLMLVGEMKFALESIPGQRGSFSDVPLIGIYYMTLILIISVATCTTSIFVHLEKYALQNPGFSAVPWCLRFLTAKQSFCCYVPRRFRINKGDETRLNKNVRVKSNHSSMDSTVFKTLIPTELNFTEYQQHSAERILTETVLTSLEPPPPLENQKLDLLISLTREMIEMKREMHNKHQLPPYWERCIKRLECVSLSFYLFLIAMNITLFLWHDLWY